MEDAVMRITYGFQAGGMSRALTLFLAANFAVMPMEGWAQTSLPPPPPPAPDAAASTAPILSPDELAKLVGPIALYPDALIGLILPASTVPTDIVMAARFLRDNKDPSQIDSQNWDPNVKGLARYPDIINMMNENLDWTNQLGAAVIAQRADVMTAIQAERAKAQALGNLQSTPQQQVTQDQGAIEIVPAEPDVIYVPSYDSGVVYTEPALIAAPFITFGVGLAVGAWLGNNCDWRRNDIYVNNGYYRGGWHGNPPPGGWGHRWPEGSRPNGYGQWNPNRNRPQPRPSYHPGRDGGRGQGTFPSFHATSPQARTRPGGTPARQGTPAGNRPSPAANRPNAGANRPQAARPNATRSNAARPAAANAKKGTIQGGKKGTPSAQRSRSEAPRRQGGSHPGAAAQRSHRAAPQRSAPSARPSHSAAGHRGGGGGHRGGGGGGRGGGRR
jgi:hypothetical protein